MAGPATLAIKIVADASKATKEIKGVGTTAKTTGAKLSWDGRRPRRSPGRRRGGHLREGRGRRRRRVRLGDRRTGDRVQECGGCHRQAAARRGRLRRRTVRPDRCRRRTDPGRPNHAGHLPERRDETARASGVFDRATTAAADLAAAGFGSLESNAATLGKILQDPAKGLAKVQKFTGPLTDSQKELITAMAEAGDVAGAQAAVLDILEGKVGGTAAATATTSDKMSVAFGEVSEAVGGVLLPILDLLAPDPLRDRRFPPGEHRLAAPPGRRGRRRGRRHQALEHVADDPQRHSRPQPDRSGHRRRRRSHRRRHPGHQELGQDLSVPGQDLEHDQERWR